MLATVATAIDETMRTWWENTTPLAAMDSLKSMLERYEAWRATRKPPERRRRYGGLRWR
jgi:hypothetical protein